MTRTLKLAIVGYAGFGRGLAEIFKELDDVEIVGVFNRGEERRKLAATDGFRTFDDYGKMLQEKELEAVVIATANCAHAAQCIEAAHAGKHIFCEKPLALEAATYDSILSACKPAGVVTHLDMTMRYGAGARRLHGVLRSGQLGRLLSITVNRVRGYGLWASGHRHPDVVHPDVSGGWNIHHNVHGTDLLLYLAGERALQVCSRQVRSSPESPCEEIIYSLLSLSSGAAAFVSDSVSILRENNIMVIGDKGSAFLRENKLVIRMEDKTETTEEFAPVKGLRDSCIAFRDACLGRARENIPFEHGRHVLDVLLAMNRSAQDGSVQKI